MLKRFCNKCKKEIPDGNPYYHIAIDREGPDTTFFTPPPPVRIGEADFCEKCAEVILKEAEK